MSHIEKNELPCNSVIREAKEESGLNIELVDTYKRSKNNNLTQPVNLRIDHIKDDHKHINLAYFAIVKSGELLKQSDEQTPLKWFSKQDLETEDLLPNVKEWALEALNQLNDN